MLKLDQVEEPTIKEETKLVYQDTDDFLKKLFNYF